MIGVMGENRGGGISDTMGVRRKMAAEDSGRDERSEENGGGRNSGYKMPSKCNDSGGRFRNVRVSGWNGRTWL